MNRFGVPASAGLVVTTENARILVFGFLLFLLTAIVSTATAADASGLHVQYYVVKGGASLPPSTLSSILFRHTGTNISVEDLAAAASDLQAAYRDQGYTNLSVAIALDRITNGVVTMNVFRTPAQQIWISGKRYPSSGEPNIVATQPQPAQSAPGSESNRAPATAATAGTNKTAMAIQNAAASRTNAHLGVLIRAYEITGDTLLSTNVLMGIFAKRTGTNVTVNDIVQAASELQMEYRNRGYPTVKVVLPPQQLTNGIVKIRVFEGRISDILVVKNQYFSSNNVMRTLPSLHPGIIISSPIFQAELDRSNANQDRQIYPQIEEGDQPNTSRLRLEVHDRLPLHAKVDFNNQSSPGTPELRLNTSAVYDNLWQREHSLGIQYGFSPEKYKTGDQWALFDKPLVANYSGFYRLPLGNFEPLAGVVANTPTSFGYDEATRKFRLPPASGRPEFNLYASRSTIDTGIETLSSRVITQIPGVLSITQTDVQEDLTVNNAIGFRLGLPVPEFGKIRSTFSAGFDYKDYNLTSSKTNLFQFSIITINPDGTPNPPVVSTVQSPVPTTYRSVDYVPLSLRWDASRPDKLGTTSFGISYTPNFSGYFFGVSDSERKFENVAGSQQATGFYHIVNSSLSRDQVIYKQWRLGVRLDGQWANQPLISNEQFGIEGVNGVRGYREGEVFGDTGWRITSEMKTPPHVVGSVYGATPLVIRGSLFMDYAEAFLLDPNGRKSPIPLWGVGFGGVASISPHFEARFLFSWPLISTSTTEAFQPRLDFGLTVQF